MIEVDGAQQSGSGTLVRAAVALAALRGQPLHVVNAREKRAHPGLRPQHVTAVRACGELCGAQTEGLAIGCREFTFVPGGGIRGGSFGWDIGTAGSATMLALSILPLACLADRPVTARITGGVFQDFAPSPHHLQHVLGALLQRMGATIDLRVLRAGYVPRGAGIIELNVTPAMGSLAALTLSEQGVVHAVRGIAFSSHLEERRVSERMAAICEQRLQEAGLLPRIECVYDTAALHAGASLAVWAESATGCVLGADCAGAPRRSSEAIGRSVAEALLADLATGATVDRYAADQLVLFAALARGTSRYLVPRQTEHLSSNLWLVEQFGGKVGLRGHEVTIDGLGIPGRGVTSHAVAGSDPIADVHVS
jgi:RNA 3'-terminal phosphate cyclase (ATP)